MKQKRQRVYRAKRPAKPGPAPTSTGTEIVLRAMLAAGPPEGADRQTAYQEWLRVLKYLADHPRSKRSD